MEIKEEQEEQEEQKEDKINALKNQRSLENRVWRIAENVQEEDKEKIIFIYYLNKNYWNIGG